MAWRISYTDAPKRVAILVSRYDHCPMDLLWRWDAGELARGTYDIPFHHLPVTKETKTGQESAMLDLLAEHEIDLVVLARYMQILIPKFVGVYPDRIVNIHHSFLPTFVEPTLIAAPTSGA